MDASMQFLSLRVIIQSKGKVLFSKVQCFFQLEFTEISSQAKV